MTASDVIMIIVVITSLAIGFFVMHFVVSGSVDRMIHNEQINASSHAKASLLGITKSLNRLDYLIFAVFLGLCLGLVVTAWLVGGHPIFAGIYFIIVSIGVMAAALLSNVWQSISHASIFGTEISYFPITNNLMTYLPFYIAGIGLLGIIVMFAKPGLEPGR